jgi:outer membrane protein insertion porin family
MRYINGLLWLTCAIFTSIACGQTVIAEAKVSGAKRLEPEAIVASAGIRAGQTFTPKDLDDAAQRLLETGMFSSVNYRYEADGPGKPGYSLTWQVEEAPAAIVVRLDIPGVDEQDLWRELDTPVNLIRPRIPGSEPASDYYRHAIEEALRKRSRPAEIVVKTAVDLPTSRLTAIFRPATVPKVSAIRFSGNSLLNSSVLEGAMNKVILGEDYSEYDARNLLTLNISPLYEEKGHLTVAFPKVGFEETAGVPGQVTVLVTLDEGQAWSLGTVDLSGDGLPLDEMRTAAQFPLGKLANWKELLACIDKAQTVLQRQGYLNARSTPVRSFQKESGTVNLEIKVNRGRQSMFGVLQLNGLSAEDQDRAVKLWELKNGVPLNGPYVDDYLRALFKVMKGSRKSVSKQLRPQPDSNLVDVVLSFK